MMRTDMNQENNRRVRRTKRILKRAFIDLLHEKNYNSISVKDIVEKADYNRSTFYFHYKYKEELVEELNESLLEGLINGFFKNDNSEGHNITETNIAIFHYILNKKEFFVLWKTSEAIPHIQEVFIQKFTRVFKKELATSTRINKAIDTDIYVVFIAYGLLGLILDWIKRDFSDTPEYMRKQLVYFLNQHPIKINQCPANSAF
ncbi:DNA-binding transcriptional regulator, AcrR family [Evansella caseinilytica]|uniref:DNA-binding transcriptional regulator, AcrR family n=1 Tax=Evansella caseinilytica TaxID=1503961 RepID=A0A1H3TU57_9BACI|nr:TetR/AcrR family transcriptional regulator [Evansella caseinilytica]SDZ53607.1 DNA-binding transcriptional regulator, AcrR family [Evansella caseinilytica]